MRARGGIGRAALAAASIGAGCAPPAGLRVVSAEAQGLVSRPEAIVGRDGGGSAAAFGRSVWVYGDTVLRDVDARGTNWHTNSYELRDRETWREAFEAPVDEVGAPRLLVDLTDEERAWNEAHGPEDCPEAPCHAGWALWPSEPLYDEAAGRAWLLYGLYSDAWPSGIGVASWGGLDAPVERRRVGGSWLLFPGPETEWANAPFVADGALHAFGCPLRGLSRPCGLARVPLDRVDQRDAWTFWDGAAWSSDSADAATLFDGAPIMAASFDAALGLWWVVYSPPFSREVLARTAPEPTGPWSRPARLFEVDGEAPYDVVHHADLAEEDGRVQWITFSRPNGDGWFGSEHALWRVEVEAR